MRAYTPPVPFVLERDYQVPYYAVYYEEVMANINEAEELLGLERTTWYRYTSRTTRQAFTPLESEREQLVGADPHFVNYILDMQGALERIYEALGTSKAEVLQLRFGYQDWAHADGYDYGKSQVSDRDLEELRFSLRILTPRVTSEHPPYCLVQAYGDSKDPDWADARQETWTEYQETVATVYGGVDWSYPPYGYPHQIESGWYARKSSYYSLTLRSRWIVWRGRFDLDPSWPLVAGQPTSISVRFQGESLCGARQATLRLLNSDQVPEIEVIEQLAQPGPDVQEASVELVDGDNDVTATVRLEALRAWVTWTWFLELPPFFAENPLPVAAPPGYEKDAKLDYRKRVYDLVEHLSACWIL